MTETQEFRRLVDRFLSSVSHDLRTPLAVISGYAELLERRPDDERLRREAPIRIREAVERLAAVLDAILMTSALDSGSIVPDAGPVDLGLVIAAVCRDAERGDHGCTIVWERNGEEWPVVHADADLVEQVLRSLVANACGYSPAGSQVTIRARVGGGRAVVSVSDEGPGMSEEELEIAFDRFARGEGALAAGIPGTGLGLYVARRLLELQEGELWAEREVGAGSTFSFSLPLFRP